MVEPTKKIYVALCKCGCGSLHYLYDEKSALDWAMDRDESPVEVWSGGRVIYQGAPLRDDKDDESGLTTS